MIKIISSEEHELWDNLVKSFANYDVCYLNGYARAFEINGDGKPQLIYVEIGNTRAINVVIKRDIALLSSFKAILSPGEWFDLSTPYGYGGFWVDGPDADGVNIAYDEYCTNQGYVCEFVRFHLLSESFKTYNGHVESRMQNIVRTLDAPLEKIMMDFEYSVRKNIKRSLENDLEIAFDTSGQTLPDFLKIYYLTMDRNKANQSFYFKQEFFETLNSLENHLVYFFVKYKGIIVSTELILFGSENCYSFLGGTDEAYYNLHPNHLLKYEIIKWAKEQGLKRYILGGGYGENDGIFSYKKAFAPHGEINYYIGHKIFCKEKYDFLLKSRFGGNIEDLNINYFPPYRG